MGKTNTLRRKRRIHPTRSPTHSYLFCEVSFEHPRLQIRESDIDALFGNLDDLIELNGHFYRTLKERLLEDKEEKRVGKCFEVFTGPPIASEGA